MSKPNNLMHPPILNPPNSNATPNSAAPAQSFQTVQNITLDLFARMVQSIIET